MAKKNRDRKRPSFFFIISSTAFLCPRLIHQFYFRRGCERCVEIVTKILSVVPIAFCSMVINGWCIVKRFLH